MFKPAHDSTASGSSSLKEPLARNNMITEDQPWISFVLICTNAHSPGLSSLFLCFSCMDHTSSKRSACSIKSTGNNRCSLGKSTLCCCLRGDSAYHMITVTYFRKESHRNSKLFTHLFIPASFFHIKAMQSISLRNILRDRICQFKCNVAVRLKDLVYFFINLRLIFPVPDDLCCRIRWLKGIS